MILCFLHTALQDEERGGRDRERERGEGEDGAR
jgi:hypothetical protein